MPITGLAKQKYNFDYSKKLLAEKRKILDAFPCKLCGESDPDLIDWHHIDPQSKDFLITGKSVSNVDRWWNEVLKCIPVCALCHRKIHANKRCLLPMNL